MRAALRTNLYRRIRRPAAKVILTVRAGAVIRRITIQTYFAAELPCMFASNVGKVLPGLNEIAIRLHDRACGGIDGLKQSVVESHCGISMVRRQKAGRVTREADGRVKRISRRNCT